MNYKGSRAHIVLTGVVRVRCASPRSPPPSPSLADNVHPNTSPFESFERILHPDKKSFPQRFTPNDIMLLQSTDPFSLETYRDRKRDFVEPFLLIRNRFLGILCFPEKFNSAGVRQCQDEMVSAFQGLHNALKDLAKAAKECPASPRIGCSSHFLFTLQTTNMKLVVAYHLKAQLGRVRGSEHLANSGAILDVALTRYASTLNILMASSSTFEDGK